MQQHSQKRTKEIWLVPKLKQMIDKEEKDESNC